MNKNQLNRERLALLEERAARQGADPLRSFTPHKKQQEFIDDVMSGKVREAWALWANRCITPWTQVEMGHATAPISVMLGEKVFDVQTWDGSSRCTRKAAGLFLKGIEPALRIYLDNNQVFECTYMHRVLTSEGWTFVGSLLSSQGDQHLWERGEDYPASYGTACRQYGLRPLLRVGNGKVAPLTTGDALSRIPEVPEQMDVMVPTPERIHACLASFRYASPDDPALLSALFALWPTRSAYTSAVRMNDLHQGSLQPAAAITPVQAEIQYQGIRDPEVYEHAYYSLIQPIPLFGDVQIIGYQKIGLRPIVDFTVDDTHCYYAGGILHHNTGKSDAGAFIDASLLRFGWPDPKTIYCGQGVEVRDRAVSAWVVSQDFPASRDIMQPKLFDNGFVPPGQHAPFIPDREIKEWRVSDQVLKLKNGSICGFKSCDSPVNKFASVGRDLIHFDEEPPRNIFDEAVIRIEAGRKLVVFATCTLLPSPGEQGGVSWVYADRVKKMKAGKLPPDVRLYQASIYDNPHIGEQEVRFLESIYPEGSPQRRIRLNGELLAGMGGARAYPGFHVEHHVRSCELDSRFPLSWMWDFNVEPLITHVGQRRGDTFYVVKQLYMESGSIPEMCDMFCDHFRDWPNDILVYGDATGQNRTGQTGMTDYTMIMNNLRNYRLHPRLKLTTVNPSVSDRLGAMNHALRNAQGEVNLIVNPECEELIADFEEVLMAYGGGIKKSHNNRDPYYKRTHASDGVGYWVSYEAPVRLHRNRRNRFMGETWEMKRARYQF